MSQVSAAHHLTSRRESIEKAPRDLECGSLLPLCGSRSLLRGVGAPFETWEVSPPHAASCATPQSGDKSPHSRLSHAGRALFSYLTLLFLLLAPTAPAAEESTKYRLTGLFAADREADLRAALEKIPGVKLERLDFPNAEATFRYDPAVAFKDTKPDKILERFDNLLKTASRSTFGLRPPSPTPREKLTPIEISIGLLDCQACALAVYEIVTKIDGVELATVNRHEGKITALVDPTKTNRTALEDALRKREVEVKKSAGTEAPPSPK